MMSALTEQQSHSFAELVDQYPPTPTAAGKALHPKPAGRYHRHLDLHGLHLTAALRRTRAEMQQAIADSSLRLTIVHGKGLHSPAKQGVLGPAVTELLKNEFGRHIRRMGNASRKRGGSGVTEVWLKTSHSYNQSEHPQE